MKSQLLLKNNNIAQVISNNVYTSKTSLPSSLIEQLENKDDLKLITAVLKGSSSNFKFWALGKKKIDGKGITQIAQERLCLNKKILNIWTN